MEHSVGSSRCSQFGSVIALLLYFRTLIYQTLSGGWEALRQRAWEREDMYGNDTKKIYL
jgi:hypothetical protein